MTRRPFSALLICSAMLCAAPLGFAPMSGCALFQSSDDLLVNYDRANEVYIGLLGIATDARLAGKISGNDWRTGYIPQFERGDRLLDSFEAAATLGDVTARERFLFLLSELNAEIQRSLIADGVEVSNGL